MLTPMGGCSSSSLQVPNEKRFRRAIKLYEVTEVSSMTNLLNRNKCFESGDSPLTLAAQEGHEEIVKTLLRNGAEVNMLDRNGRCPLHIACHMNDQETVDVLIEHKADVNKYDEYFGLTPLQVACERGFTKIVQKLLEAGADANEQQRGMTALIYATVGKHGDCIHVLLQHNADPNVTDGRGVTPLRHAVANSDVESVAFMLQRGASPSFNPRDNETLVVLAAVNGDSESIRELAAAGCDVRDHKLDEPPPLIAAVVRGHADVVETLCKLGCDVNITDKRTQSAIQIACWMTADNDKSHFYLRYFSNMYRNFSRYDPENINQESSCNCAMSLVEAGADVTRVWERFPVIFPDLHVEITYEQMVLCEVLIQAYGFQQLSLSKLRAFVLKIIHAKQYGILTLLYSAGVNPTKDELAVVAMTGDESGREMFKYVKALMSKPRQLKDLCRQRIRKLLSGNVLYAVKQLDIKTEDKEYVGVATTDYFSKT